jgi:CBS domain-containing protein
MTDASALVVIDPSTSCRAAEELACRHAIHHLLVVAHGALVGVLCRCDLALHRDHDDVTIRSLMAEEIFAIHPTATLGAALAAMRTLKVGCLPVVADGFLVGVISRGDLRRAGIPEENGVIDDPGRPAIAG